MKKDILKLTAKAVFTFAAALSMTAAVNAASISDTIYNSVKSAAKTIDVSSFHVTPQQAMDSYFDVVSLNPDLFYIDYHVDCKYDTKSGECQELICSYTTNDVKGEVSKFNAAVNSAAAQANGLATNFDKVKAVHDYMITNFDFGADGLTAYSLATSGKGNCTAYSGFFKAAMDKLGIPCKIAWSEDMCHEWNLVQIDGSWYHADITWDDPIGGSGITYSSFLKSDSLIKMSGHFNWKTDGNIACTNTQYDTMG